MASHATKVGRDERGGGKRAEKGAKARSEGAEREMEARIGDGVVAYKQERGAGEWAGERAGERFPSRSPPPPHVLQDLIVPGFNRRFIVKHSTG